MDELKMPLPEPNGFVVTLNQQGYMTSTVDVFMQSFIDFAGTINKPVVDIGAAYGVATIPALVKGATVIANDLDERHLLILRERVPETLKEKLSLYPGRFPDELSFKSSSIGAFMIARVVHFFSPEKLIESAEKLFEWLDVGGKVFLTAETPYLKNWESFIPIFEQRKKEGNLWAGFVDDVMKYAPERGKFLPKTMLFLDPSVLRIVFENAGFEIEKVDFLSRPEFPEDLRRDGRESVGLICKKV